MATITLYDNNPYNSGSYTVNIAAFNVGSLVYGTDYTESMQFQSGAMLSSVTANWSFPITSVQKINSFMAIDYGNYYNTSTAKFVPSSRISDITTLVEGINFTMSGNLQGFNVITDIFLTSVAGNNSTNAAEVEIFFHTPADSQAWFSSLKALGTITIYGITWKVAQGTDSAGLPDYIFMPANGADVTSGAINVKTMLQYLVNNGGLSSSLYFNGLATGVETSSGSGSWTMTNFGVTYATTAPVPGVTVALANQTGQTINGVPYTYNPNLTGKADANSAVTLYDGAAVVATVTSDANGVWSFDGSSLANGYHNIKAAETNSYGNSGSASVAFQLWKTQNSISEMIQYMAGQGTNGVYTVAPDIVGWTSPNTAVQIYDGSTAIGAATSDSSGYYSYQTSNLTDGAHNIGVAATNLYGSTAHASLQFTFL
jgi:hypothetical protein